MTTTTAEHSALSEVLSGNTRYPIIGLAVIILAIVGYSMISSRNEARTQAAQSALYQAQKLVLAETPKIKKPAPPAPAAKPGEPAPKAAEPIEEPQFDAKYDVDQKMAGSVQALRKVSEDYGKTRAGFDAALSLGDLYQNHGEPAKAAPWYVKAGEIAPDSLGRALAYASQGYALEESGKLPEARQAFERVVNSGEAALKGDALLGIARIHQRLGETPQAITAYDQVISQMPGTDSAKTAETLKAQLPAAGGAK
jgi:tetratricopeptide (TPR) repeat protein